MRAILTKHSASLLLFGSLASSIFLGALLTAWHIPFVSPILSATPIPSATPAIGWASAGAAQHGGPPKSMVHSKVPSMVHFLSPRCRCSERLAAYLLSRPARAEMQESVVLLPSEALGALGVGGTENADSLEQAMPLLRQKGYRIWPDSTVADKTVADKIVADKTVAGKTVPAPKPSHLELTGKIPGAPWLLIEDENGSVVYSGGYEVAPYWDARILYAVQTKLVQASLPATGCAASTKLRAGNFALRLKDLIQLSSPKQLPWFAFGDPQTLSSRNISQ